MHYAIDVPDDTGVRVIPICPAIAAHEPANLHHLLVKFSGGRAHALLAHCRCPGCQVFRIGEDSVPGGAVSDASYPAR